MAYKANLNFVIKDIKYQLYNKYGDDIFSNMFSE